MSDLFWLGNTQMARLDPDFPKSHGKPQIDDRRVLSGIIFNKRNDALSRRAKGLRPVENALQPLEALEVNGGKP